MHNQNQLPLLIRPRAEESEGVAEYLQRLAKANGFNTLLEMLDLFGVPLNDIVASGHEKLRNVIVGNAPASSLKIEKNSRRGISPHVDFAGVFARARVCCSCLNESDVIACEWSKPLSISCAKHFESLLDFCPVCNRKIERKASQYRCLCGQKFGELRKLPSPPWEERFYELFAPWRIYPDHEDSEVAIVRAEIYTARVINKLIESASPTKCLEHSLRNWVSTAHHNRLSGILSDEAKLGSAIWNVVPSKQVNRGWRPIASEACERMPLVFELMDGHRRLLNIESRREASDIRKIKSAYADSVTNIAKVLEIDWRTANQLIGDKRWQRELRRSIKAKRLDSLLICVTRWKDNTYSVDEVRKLTGLDGTWLKTFCEIYRTDKLGSRRFSVWRFPKESVDRFMHGVERCVQSANAHFNVADGYLPLKQLPKEGGALQHSILGLVAEGSLPLIQQNYESQVSVRLLECIAPARAIDQFEYPSWQKARLRALIQYPEARACLS